MTSLGQGGGEVTGVAVPVLAEAPAATGQSWVVTQSSADGTTTSQPRRSGRDKPGDSAGEPKNRGVPSVPGLADWLLAAVAALPTAVGLARSCSGASVVDA